MNKKNLEPNPYSRSIRGFVSVGAGEIKGLYVNGKKVLDSYSWKGYAIFDALYGGFSADDKLVVQFSQEDKTYVEENTNYGTVYNSCTGKE